MLQFIPHCLLSGGVSYPEWFTHSCDRAVKEKNRLLDHWRRHPSSSSHHRFICAAYNSTVKKVRENFIRLKAPNCLPARLVAVHSVALRGSLLVTFGHLPSIQLSPTPILMLLNQQKKLRCSVEYSPLTLRFSLQISSILLPIFVASSVKIYSPSDRPGTESF